MSLTNSQIKLVRSMSDRKSRREYGLFLCEGVKALKEVLPHFTPFLIAATEKGANEIRHLTKSEITITSKKEIERASLLQSPPDALALLYIPNYKVDCDSLSERLVIALDNVQDPGNVGTILRIADWFGIKDVLISNGTADPFNPKTIQATMGAISRVRTYQCDLKETLSELSKKTPLYGTFLDGEVVYNSQLQNNGVIVMGSEGHGISPEIESLITKRLFIPNYPKGEETSESLNVAVATAIICSEFRRRT